MDFLLLVVFIFEIIFFITIDRLLFGTYFTPTSVLAVPYLFVVLLAIIVGPKLGFVNFYYPSLWVWIVGLVFFWLPSSVLAVLFLKKTNIKNNPYQINNSIELDKLILKISYFIIGILIIGFIKSLRFGKIGTDEFSGAYGSGISGHTMLISKLFFIYLIINFQKKHILPIIIILLLYLSYGAKSWILIPILAGIISRILLKKTMFSFKLMIKIVLFAVFLFYISYRIVLGPQMPFYFVYLHFFRYVFSGVLGFSEYFRQQKEIGFDPEMIIEPIINIYNKLTGAKIHETYSNILTYIGNDAKPNVKSFFGTIYIYAGIAWGCLFSFLKGLLSYFLLIYTISTKNLIFLIIYVAILTLLLFGWFDTFSSNLFFYEFPVFGFLFYLLYPGLLKIKILKTVK